VKKIYALKSLFFGIFFLSTLSFLNAQQSVARQWNDVLLEAIRNDFARPTVHSRNLFHTSVAMYDAWAAYDDTATTFLLGKTVRGYFCPFDGIATPPDIQAAREEAISYAMFRLLNYRFASSPGGVATLNSFSNLFNTLGYNPNNFSTNYSTGDPAALGNYIASEIIAFGQQDGSNEQGAYENLFYETTNPPLVTNFSGNPDIIDPNRWQPLTLDVFIDQSGNEFPYNTPEFLGPEWGQVTPFALKDEDLTLHQRDGDVYWVYHDPGYPPYLDTTAVGGISEEYKWNFSLVSIWSSHLDPESSNDTLWDISPASIGNIQVEDYPTTVEGLRDFYNLEEGGDYSTGHPINPVTGQPYAPQMVSRADYGRVLAEFWADGPDSETPPGHWFTLLNYVNDHPLFEKRYRGQGDILDDLEWDVKAYFIMGGTVHDAAVTAWGVKGWYDYIRPISAIRCMAEFGQSTSDTLPSYHPGGIPLREGFIELVDSTDALAGANFENVGKIKVFAWKGPDYINIPAIEFAGVDWILADDWWPYQRPSFVTPPFAGYVSGHSTFSRAAAEVMTMLTGDAYFPGGMGEFDAFQNEFLVFEEGPSTDVFLQWATYRDASDQCSLSRIWGGIHPPADDIPGRLMGIEIGVDAFNFAETYFFIDEDQDGYFNFEDCDDTNAAINPGAPELCNGLDENCNNLIDEDTDVYTYYLDADNDTYGDINMPFDTCQNFAPANYVNNSWDCNDNNPDINPDAMETCDDVDNNCNTEIDEGLVLITYYLDADEDTFGDANEPIQTCHIVAPTGYVTNSMDCDDSNAAINPDALEACDGIDNDCNNLIDDGLPLFTYYYDADQDTYGNPEDSIEICDETPPEGYVLNSMDCDDYNNTINPDGIEIINNGIDEDCVDGDFMVGVEDNTFDEQIELFPNPFMDRLTIRSEYQGELIIQIVSGEGRLISKNIRSLENGSSSINLDNIPSGIYFVIISNTEGTKRYFEKVIKQQ
jgi:uncharacterized protein DUF6851/putative metal-binding protein/type IX secretion system substrate protein